MTLRHTTITVDGRCLDLLLTDEEISAAFERSLKGENQNLVDKRKCCSCWPVNRPPECSFWRRILGICKEYDTDIAINSIVDKLKELNCTLSFDNKGKIDPPEVAITTQ